MVESDQAAPVVLPDLEVTTAVSGPHLIVDPASGVEATFEVTTNGVTVVRVVSPRGGTPTVVD